MKVSFYGGAGEVTGSNYLLEIDSGQKILIDCGMFQGSEFNQGRNADKFPYDPRDIDALILTHAHLDHCGRIPKLVHEGFKGAIHATEGTLKLAELIWKDAVNIMSYEYKKYGSPMVYHEDDVMAAALLGVSHKYDEWFEMAFDGIRVRFREAGHIFGSSFVEIEINGKRIVFSGDVGNDDVPILRDTAPMEKADALVIESTYGNRVHEPSKEREERLEKHIVTAVSMGGVLMIPAFSIERTQELLYTIHQLKEHGRGIPDVPIFLDSPLSIDAIKVYKEHPEYYDSEAKELKDVGDDFFKIPGLVLTRSVEESKKINSIKPPFILIAGSGMLDGGRILHHAFRYLSDPRSTLLITGFCALGTRGRKIIDGAKSVNIFGQNVPVLCRVESIKALSAHADREKLVRWAQGILPKQIFIVHGESDSSGALQEEFRKHFPKAKSVIPKFGDGFAI